MRLSKETLRGYILEEVLAYLIRNTGYELLVDRTQDPYELENKGHGLVVKGRGTVHQADVLGQLRWIPAFTYPCGDWDSEWHIRGNVRDWRPGAPT